MGAGISISFLMFQLERLHGERRQDLFENLMKVLDVPKNTHKDTLNFTHRFRQSTGVRLKTRSLEPKSDSVSSHRSHSSQAVCSGKIIK